MSYSLQQQAFCLSYISNILFDTKGSKEELEEIFTREATKILADATVKQLIGEWTIVWGPGIFVAKDSDVPSHVAFIAKKVVANEAYYCLSVAGTNANSSFNWLFENLNVNKLVPWKEIDVTASDDSGSIALGTSFGVKIVLGIDKKNGITSNGKTVIEFVKELQFESDKSFFITSGHSLGGALSPVAAVYIRSLLVNQPQVCVHAYPTAGPTTGNQEWVDYMAQQLQEIKAVNNSLDCVPRAWDQISAIKAIYDIGTNPIKTPTIFSVFIDGQELIFRRNNISYKRGATIEFKGEINPKMTTFVSQTLYQHIGNAATKTPSPYEVYLVVGQFIDAARNAVLRFFSFV